ncbi:MAG: single-stranded DNA-binding protein [Candidatus Aminicenantes bacterium]|nr:single-stranded DNA-binding protein [Candidatus Aminicenantes bacterium]
MFNKAILIGRLGRDPEVRYTTSGTAVTDFSVATNEVWTDQNGERQERTEWHRIVAWSRLAEICEKYLRKGSLVMIEGRIQTREWEDRDGNQRRTTEIRAFGMKMLDSRTDRMGGGPRGDRTAPRSSAPSRPSQEVEITDDDIPF